MVLQMAGLDIDKPRNGEGLKLQGLLYVLLVPRICH